MNGFNFPRYNGVATNTSTFQNRQPVHQPRLSFGSVSHLQVSSPAWVGYREVDNFRSEGRSRKAGFPLKRLNTYDERTLIKRQGQQHWSKTFLKAVKDYLGYNSNAQATTRHLLKKEIPRHSIACLGGKEVYRGVAVPSELIIKVQKALNETGHYGAKGMMHGGNSKRHHGITSVSTLPEVANQFARGRSQLKNMHPLFITLKMNNANPGRIIVPKFNCFAAGNQPHVWHEILLDRMNEYAVKSLTYSDTHNMYQMEIAVSTDMFRRKNVLNKYDKINYWNSIYDDIKDREDSIVKIDYSGTPTFRLESPDTDYRQTLDSDNNALVDLARNTASHESAALGTNYRFKVVRAQDSTKERPHYLILPRPCEKGNYKDLKSFLDTASDEQKVSLMDTMTALATMVPPQKKTYNPEVFKINSGSWQRIPYFSIHYRPYG